MAQPNARDTGLPCVHYLRDNFTLNELLNGGSTGVLLGTIPSTACIIHTIVRVEQAFNASGTNVLTVGTNSSVDNLAGSADVTEGSLQTQLITTGSGVALTGDTDIFVKFAQTGSTPATTGVASVIVTYAPK